MMWEDYIGENLAVPADTDRARLEKRIGARLPDAYWDLVMHHRGQALDAEAIEVPGQGTVDFGVLLLSAPKTKDE